MKLVKKNEQLSFLESLKESFRPLESSNTIGEYEDTWEDIGTRESYPEINEQIERFNLEVKVSTGVIRSAIRVAFERYPLEGGSCREIRGRLRGIRKVGWPVECYSDMGLEQLREYIRKLKTEISDVARKNCPDVLIEITKGNERRVQEFHHY